MYIPNTDGHKLNDEDKKAAKKLAELHSLDVLIQAVNLRSRRDERTKEGLPTMHHFVRLRYNPYASGKNKQLPVRQQILAEYREQDGRYSHPHKCLPECGMYTRKEATAVLHKDWIAKGRVTTEELAG